jgi:CMP-N-acetylneuraminic acid synthetase
MYKGKKILVIIPARGRNDGVKHMNMRELGEKPLIFYTIRAAQTCEFIDKIIVSTEDTEIANYACSLGVDIPFLRDPKLASKNAIMESIIEGILDYLRVRGEKYDYLLNLYPNAPFKSRELILRFLDQLPAYDYVIPLYGHKNYFWEQKGNTTRLMIDRQRTIREKAVKKYEELGGIYAYNLANNKWKKSLRPRIGFCELDFHDSRMVNNIYDLIMLEKLVKLPKMLINDLLKSEYEEEYK